MCNQCISFLKRRLLLIKIQNIYESFLWSVVSMLVTKTKFDASNVFKLIQQNEVILLDYLFSLLQMKLTEALSQLDFNTFYSISSRKEKF